MKIVSLVSYKFLPARSGGQKGIALFYKYFSSFHEVFVVSTRNNLPELAQGYKLLNILSESKLRYINPRIFFQLRSVIRKMHATHFILEHPYFGWLGLLIKKFCGVRLIVHSHNIESKRWRTLGKWWWRILWQYEKMTHRSADYNFFIQDEDRRYAIENFGLQEKKCLTVSFRTEIERAPDELEHLSAGKIIRDRLGIENETPLLLFNGAFSYLPNRDALYNLILRINPLLIEKKLPYAILIIGLDIPASLEQSSEPNICVLGFVEDLELFLTGSDIFLNPVRSGGGIKTKLVEALAYNLTSVSTKNGAIGIDPSVCGGKLIISPDHNWSLFADAIVQAMSQKTPVPKAFYETFFWGKYRKTCCAVYRHGIKKWLMNFH